uniref:Inhibin beta B chain-like n=1 Tax=Geotrypetes seraphini TaxID=260995 RepID=A0A6P8QCD1_GEOSA|nr:inhibin beta B chain-like [Geotrypetes seraphini]
MEKEVLFRLVKQNILNKLHLKERPNMTEPVSRAMLVTALRRLQGRKGGQDRILEIPREDQERRSEGFTPQYEIISFAESECADAPHTCLYIKFPLEKTENTEIFIVDIWLFLQASHGSRHIIVRSSLSDRNGLEQVFISEKQLEVKGSGWHTLSMTSSIYKMLSRGFRRLRIELMCKDCQDLQLMVNNGETQRSFLIAKARAKVRQRIKKRSMSCNGHSDMCCRKDFYIDFKEIGWSDWIIKPEGYYMNYCEGACPVHLAGIPGIAASFHTAVLNLIKANNVFATGRSCCVPTLRRPLSMLYFDKDRNVIKTDIPDMIVEACGCI